jgi:hypothetical protein
MLDTSISAIILVLNLILAYLCLRLTLHPADEPVKKRKYKIGFIILASLVIVVGCIQTYRNYKAQDAVQGQLNRIDNNTKDPKQANVQITNNVPPAQVISQFLPQPILPGAPSSPPRPNLADIEAHINRLTLHDLWLQDFTGPTYTQITGSISVTDTEPKQQVEYAILKNAVDRGKFITFYIGENPLTFDLCTYLSRQTGFVLDKAPQMDFNMKTIGDSEEMSTSNLTYNGRVFIYHATFLTEEQNVQLSKTFRALRQALILRSTDYLSNKKMEMKVVKFREAK